MDINFVEQTGNEAREVNLEWARKLFGGAKSEEQLLDELNTYILRACESED